MITQSELRNILEYRDDGNFYWKVALSDRTTVGTIAGSVKKHRKHTSPYRYITLYGKTYLAHRLVWLYEYGMWPTSMLDHIDADGLNNKLDNLREATVTQNMHNRSKPRTNVSGYKGVSWHTRRSMYRAVISINGKSKHLGYFVEAIDAAHKYQEVAKVLHGDYYRE